MVVALHHGFAARLGSLAHRLAGFDGLVLEVDGADGRVHGAQEEEQVRAAAGAWADGGGAEFIPGPCSVRLTFAQPTGGICAESWAEEEDASKTNTCIRF